MRVEPGGNAVERPVTGTLGVEQVQDPGPFAHPVLGLSFTPGRKHPSHDQGDGPVDLIPVEVQGLQDLGELQQIQRFERHALAANGARVRMMDLVREDGIPVIAWIMDIIALAFELLHDVLTGLAKDFIFKRQARMSAQAVADEFHERWPLFFGEIEVLAEVEEGSLPRGSVDAIGFND